MTERPLPDPERDEVLAGRLALLKDRNEVRWTDLFNRQQAERDALFERDIFSRMRSAMFIFRALRAEKPDAGMRAIFNLMGSEKLRLELAGRHQLRERKAMAKAISGDVGKVHREVAAQFDARRPD